MTHDVAKVKGFLVLKVCGGRRRALSVEGFLHFPGARGFHALGDLGAFDAPLVLVDAPLHLEKPPPYSAAKLGNYQEHKNACVEMILAVASARFTSDANPQKTRNQSPVHLRGV